MKNGNGHQVAIWAGVGAFFASLLAIGAIDILNPSDRAQFVGALFVSFITAGAVYSKQRLDDAKKKYDGSLKIKETGDRKRFSLELEKDPEVLEKKDEVTFKVERE